MPDSVTTEALRILLKGTSQVGLVDVREPGEYNSTHIPGASLIPRRLLEFQMSLAVPFKGAHVVVCDDDGRRAKLAAATVERMGYIRVSVLEGGINHWTTEGHPTEWGTNVPSKDFGEKMEAVYHVPEIEATTLQAMIDRGEKLVILDTRTPEEYQRFCIPGGRSVPGAELALRITDITRDLDSDASVVVNCAGRTRSIIGTRMLQRLGMTNVYGLKNGTSGWTLAGYELEQGADRLELPEPSPEGLAAAEKFASRLAADDGVRYLDVCALQAFMDRRDRDTVYLIDVRTEDEYAEGHIPGFRWFPGGQAVQRSDEVGVVKNSTIVFACDGKARATFTASWYRQMGFEEVYVAEGGTTAWANAGLTMDKGFPASSPFGLAEAREKLNFVSPRDLHDSAPPIAIFVDTSQDFVRGHVAGSRWVPRGWLESQIGDVAPDQSGPIAVTCSDGRNSALAGATLLELGYKDIQVLDGGMTAWQGAGLPVERGLTGVMQPPTDVVYSGPDRNYADMMTYLRWEEALGSKYAAQAE